MNKIGYTGYKKIGDLLPLKDYSEHWDYVRYLFAGGAKLVYHAHLRAKDRTRVPKLLSEIERLKAQLAAQQQQENTAAKNGLLLYAENEVLRKYKSLAEGEMRNFVHIDDHRFLKKENESLKEKLARVSKSLDDFQSEFGAYLSTIKKSSYSVTSK